MSTRSLSACTNAGKFTYDCCARVSMMRCMPSSTARSASYVYAHVCSRFMCEWRSSRTCTTICADCDSSWTTARTNASTTSACGLSCIELPSRKRSQRHGHTRSHLLRTSNCTCARSGAISGSEVICFCTLSRVCSALSSAVANGAMRCESCAMLTSTCGIEMPNIVSACASSASASVCAS